MKKLLLILFLALSINAFSQVVNDTVVVNFYWNGKAWVDRPDGVLFCLHQFKGSYEYLWIENMGLSRKYFERLMSHCDSIFGINGYSYEDGVYKTFGFSRGSLKEIRDSIYNYYNIRDGIEWLGGSSWNSDTMEIMLPIYSNGVFQDTISKSRDSFGCVALIWNGESVFEHPVTRVDEWEYSAEGSLRYDIRLQKVMETHKKFIKTWWIIDINGKQLSVKREYIVGILRCDD